MAHLSITAGVLFACGFLANHAAAQATGDVLNQVRHAPDPGAYFDGRSFYGDRLGSALEAIGDWNGDGTVDLAVGLPFAGVGGEVWLVYLAADGSVLAHDEIGDGKGGFSSSLNSIAQFGSSISFLGDLDGDGVGDLVVGAPGNSIIGPRLSSVWVLFLNADGSVKSEVEISAGKGGFNGDLQDNDSFGQAVAVLGDITGDGITDLAVGSPDDDGAGDGRGVVWILALATDGTVVAHRKIGEATGAGFVGPLIDSGHFGRALGALGDFDSDGVPDLLVGAPGSPTSLIQGEVWGLLLLPDGGVKAQVRICSDFDTCSGPAVFSTSFGWSVRAAGDLDGNGATDIFIGEANARRDAVDNVGALWTVLLEPDGSVRYANEFSVPLGGYSGAGQQIAHFGGAIAILGDRDGNGMVDVAVGAPGDDQTQGLCSFGLCEYGAFYLLDLEGGFARQSVRNGSGSNALCLGALDPPVLGMTWTATVDANGHPGAGLTFLVAYASGNSGIAGPFGEVLVEPSSALLLIDFASSGGSAGTHTIGLPFDANLLGMPVFTQGGILGGAGPELCNALDLCLGI